MKHQIFLCSLAFAISFVAARELNEASLNHIKESEGWRECAYKDIVGKWTIGYGHLLVPGNELCRPVPTTQCCITKEKGLEVLKSDISTAANAIDRIVTVPLTDNQFGALTSWAYNVGSGNARASTLVKLLNGGDYNAVCGELKKWNKAGGKEVQGLTNRRNKECNLFSKP